MSGSGGHAAGAVPLVLYNTSRAKRKVGPELLRRLTAVEPTLIGMKDTGCDVPTLKAMLTEAPDLANYR